MKAILVLDISDNMLKKHNEKIEDLSISFTVNGRVENYCNIHNSHKLKPMPDKKTETVDVTGMCWGEQVEEALKKAWRNIDWNDCLYEITGEKK